MNLELFSGKPSPFGGLSNERELVKICPEDFKNNWTSNKWCNYASKLFFSGGSIKNWKWKTIDTADREIQLRCFYGLLGTFGIPHESKEAVAGWMLSEMLEELPETK